jgi:lipopolysaccharide/colanic/teichoic acid biosynthesis glycosyltransferase
MDYVAMYKLFVKRLLDILFSILLLPLFIISLFILAPAIYLSDKGPVFFNSIRRGKDGKRFEMHKYRSMKANAPMIASFVSLSIVISSYAPIDSVRGGQSSNDVREIPRVIVAQKMIIRYMGSLRQNMLP